MVPRLARWLIVPLGLAIQPMPDRTAPRYGIWYWHTPFAISDADRKSLREIGIQDLYVRAGTLSTDGKRVVTILPQRWESKADGYRLVLVMNFDPGLVSHLDEIPVATMADDVKAGLLQARDRARAAGLSPSGYQLDVDCPTRLLSRYAAVLRKARRGLDAPLSITGLTSWLNSNAVVELASSVDRIVPQFYEGRTGRSLKTVAPVADVGDLSSGLHKLGLLGAPCSVGLASYGHALLYGTDGRLASMYQGLSPVDALRHPSLRFQTEGPFANGERKLIMRAVAPDMNGRGMGSSIAYVLPSAEAVRRQVEIFERERPPNCRGAIFYRFPEPNEGMTLPLTTLAAAKRGEPTRVELALSLQKASVPWDAISRGRATGTLPTAIRVRAVATGKGPSTTQPRAVMVLLRLDRPGIEAVAPGDFDRAEVGTLNGNGQFLSTGRARADVVLLSRNHLLPGEVLRSGDIETVPNGATRVSAEWAAKSPDGETRGRSSNLLLTASP